MSQIRAIPLIDFGGMNLAQVTWQNLVQRYGFERACRIRDGKDPDANADRAAWERLGEPKP